jgi:hypothetical protein
MADSNKFVLSDASFDPETLNLLSGAFEDAWLKIQTSGNRLARPGYANVMREVMAKHIFHLAQRGERNEMLSARVRSFFLPPTTRHKLFQVAGPNAASAGVYRTISWSGSVFLNDAIAACGL